MTPNDASAILIEVQGLRREIERDRSELKDDLSEIKTQTTRTNGRVTALEAWRIKQEAKDESKNGIIRWILPVVTGVVSGSGVVLLSLLLTHQL